MEQVCDSPCPLGDLDNLVSVGGELRWVRFLDLVTAAESYGLHVFRGDLCLVGRRSDVHSPGKGHVFPDAR